MGSIEAAVENRAARTDRDLRDGHSVGMSSRQSEQQGIPSPGATDAHPSQQAAEQALLLEEIEE